jgi:hypothetical protein
MARIARQISGGLLAWHVISSIMRLRVTIDMWKAIVL